jgi:hypothetical protein
MLGIWKPRLLARRVEPASADSNAWDDGHVLGNEEVEKIARSLIAEAPQDENQRRVEIADARPRDEGWKIAR